MSFEETGTVTTPPAWKELLTPGRLGTSVVLASGVLVGAVNIYLASGLLPTVVAAIGGSGFYAWNMTLYLVAMVIATMLAGRLLARWGNVGAYLVGFGVFAAGSAVCALSPAMGTMLAGRGVQGIGAGLLSGLGFAVVRTVLPPRLWIRGNALMSAMYGVGTFAGPALGGLFAQIESWRLAFAVMVVAAVGCGVLAVRVLPGGQRSETRTPLPVRSLVLASGAAVAVSVAGVLTNPIAMIAAVVLAVVLAVAFVLHERCATARVLPPATYRGSSPLKWVYLTLGLLTFGVAVETFVPLFGQRLGGLMPIAAGLLGATMSLGWSLTQIASSSAGPGTARRLRVLGPVVLAAGLLVLGMLMWADPPWWLVAAWVPVLLAAGAGVGLAYPHLAVAAMASSSDPDEGRQAAAAIATVTSLSIGFGTAVAGVLVQLGGEPAEPGARAVFCGVAVICAAGVFTARRSDRKAA